MSENKITIAINPNQGKKGPPQIDGMIALKKIENYSYALSDEIGLGYSSHVYRGKNDLTNQLAAVKVIDLHKQDELSKQFVNEEINILEALKGRNPKNLLALFDVFKTKNNLYIITEFCEGKDVAKLLRKKKRIPQNQAQSIMKQLLNAYHELHEFGIVHRDLKLANIFIKKGTVKLADFGFAISSDRCNEPFSYNVGSPYYMPPESLKQNRYSFKSDVWSLGVIAFEMIYGHLPWKEKVQTVLFQKIRSTPIHELFQPDVAVSQHYKDFITGCLQIEKEQRVSPEWAISYEWPLASDYVEGVEPEPKSLPLNKMPSGGPLPVGQSKTAHLIEEERQSRSRRRINHQISMPTPQQRDKSPTNRQEFVFKNFMEEQPRHKTIAAEPHRHHHEPSVSEGNIILRPLETPRSRGESGDPQLCIMSQVHYCRFLGRLFEAVQAARGLPQQSQIKSDIASLIIAKSEMLLRISQGENLLNLQGFTSYQQSHRWPRLRNLIERYDGKYHIKFVQEMRGDSGEQALLKSIRSLRSNVSTNFHILEELLYWYQLRQLQKKSSLEYFANNSKLQMLCSRSSKPVMGNAALYDRLNTRIGLLGV